MIILTPEEINKINAKNKKLKTPKKILYCHKCGRSREVDYDIDFCPICKTQLEICVVKKRNFIPQPNLSSNQPHCPICNSTNIKRISDLRRGIHAVAWGLFSKTARSQFECKNCGMKF